MPVKEQKLELLTRLGYSTVFRHDPAIRQISIDGIPQGPQPVLKIHLLYQADMPIGKAVSDRQYTCSVAMLEVDDLPPGEITGWNMVRQLAGQWYFSPGSKLLEALLALTAHEHLLDALWLLALEIKTSSRQAVRTADAVFLVQQQLPTASAADLQEHPLLTSDWRGMLCFISDEMREYCLARELNKKQETSAMLRSHITAETLPYLDFVQKQGMSAGISLVEATKQRMVRHQKYELAALYRDAERALQIEMLRLHWPDLDDIDGVAMARELLIRNNLEI